MKNVPLRMFRKKKKIIPFQDRSRTSGQLWAVIRWAAFWQSRLCFVFVAKAAVSFTQNLEDADAQEKDTMVTFECETSEPFVKVKWLKNNAEIFSGDKYRMHSDRKVHFLSVLVIQVSDDAEYACVLVDDDGIRTVARLHVQGDLDCRF